MPDEEALARVMDRIEGEATRMGLLVEDLLLLARLDQQRLLEREPVDLPPIVADAVSDARMLAPGTGSPWRRRVARTRSCRWCSATKAACARSWPTSSPTPGATPRPAPRSPCGWRPRARPRWSRSPTTGRGSRRTTPPGRSSASTGPTGPYLGPGRDRARAVDRRRPGRGPRWHGRGGRRAGRRSPLHRQTAAVPAGGVAEPAPADP